jgi:hypothetical protein
LAKRGPLRKVTVYEREVTSTELAQEPHGSLDDVVQSEEFTDRADENALRLKLELTKAEGPQNSRNSVVGAVGGWRMNR